MWFRVNNGQLIRRNTLFEPGQQIVASVVPMDFDWDGRMDIASLVQKTNALVTQFFLHRRQGAAVGFTQRNPASGSECWFPSGVHHSDLCNRDSKGRAHNLVVVASGGFSAPGLSISQDGSCHKQSIDTLMKSHYMACADLNADGEMDYVQSSDFGYLSVLDGDSPFPVALPRDLNQNTALRNLVILDYDRDGDLDVLAAADGYRDRSGVALYMNQLIPSVEPMAAPSLSTTPSIVKSGPTAATGPTTTTTSTVPGTLSGPATTTAATSTTTIKINTTTNLAASTPAPSVQDTDMAAPATAVVATVVVFFVLAVITIAMVVVRYLRRVRKHQIARDGGRDSEQNPHTSNDGGSNPLYEAIQPNSAGHGVIDVDIHAYYYAVYAVVQPEP